jgi:hypothetical protein
MSFLVRFPKSDQLKRLAVLLMCCFAEVEDQGEDLANVTAAPRAEALLKWFGKLGWTPVEESLKECCDTMGPCVG